MFELMIDFITFLMTGSRDISLSLMLHSRSFPAIWAFERKSKAELSSVILFSSCYLLTIFHSYIYFDSWLFSILIINFFSDQSKEESSHHGPDIRCGVRPVLRTATYIHDVFLFSSEITRVVQRVLALSKNCWILLMLPALLRQSCSTVFRKRSVSEILQQVRFSFILRKTCSNLKIQF